MADPMCANCSNASKFVLMNGDEIEIYCEPCFQEVLVDLAVNNDQFTLTHVEDEDRPSQGPLSFREMRAFRVG